MNKNPSDEFFDSIDFSSIIDTIKGVFTSDGTMNTLLDFERVLDESDLYAYKNWELGELVAGPDVERYQVSCMFMYPARLMPDPRGAKRLLSVGCSIKFKKTEIKVPIQIKDPGDYKPGTHFPKMVQREVWLVRITMPKDLMNDIREGSIDLAGQTINLEELDTAYEDDLDKEGTKDQNNEQGMDQAPGSESGMGGMAPPPPAGQVPLGGGM